MRNMTSNILLSRAAKLVEKNGLAKGEYINNAGQTCTLGALIVGKYGDNKSVREEFSVDNANDEMATGKFLNAIVKGAVKKLATTLKIVGTDYESTLENIISWSDKPGRRKGDVVKAFRKSITR